MYTVPLLLIACSTAALLEAANESYPNEIIEHEYATHKLPDKSIVESNSSNTHKSIKQGSHPRSDAGSSIRRNVPKSNENNPALEVFEENQFVIIGNSPLNDNSNKESANTNKSNKQISRESNGSSHVKDLNLSTHNGSNKDNPSKPRKTSSNGSSNSAVTTGGSFSRENSRHTNNSKNRLNKNTNQDPRLDAMEETSIPKEPIVIIIKILNSVGHDSLTHSSEQSSDGSFSNHTSTTTSNKTPTYSTDETIPEYLSVTEATRKNKNLTILNSIENIFNRFEKRLNSNHTHFHHFALQTRLEEAGKMILKNIFKFISNLFNFHANSSFNIVPDDNFESTDSSINSLPNNFPLSKIKNLFATVFKFMGSVFGFLSTHTHIHPIRNLIETARNILNASIHSDSGFLAGMSTNNNKNFLTNIFYFIDDLIHLRMKNLFARVSQPIYSAFNPAGSTKEQFRSSFRNSN